jgi:hypothetical protein
MTTPAVARYTEHRFPAEIKSGSDVGNRRLEVAEVRMIEAAEVKVALRAHRLPSRLATGTPASRTQSIGPI